MSNVEGAKKIETICNAIIVAENSLLARKGFSLNFVEKGFILQSFERTEHLPEHLFKSVGKICFFSSPLSAVFSQSLDRFTNMI